MKITIGFALQTDQRKYESVTRVVKVKVKGKQGGC